MPTNPDEFTLDLRDPDSISKLTNWCWEHLTKDDYTATIITMFPLQYRFRFQCSKTLVMAALSV